MINTVVFGTDDMSDNERNAYVDCMIEKYPELKTYRDTKMDCNLIIEVNGDDVDLTIDIPGDPIPFQRIRRITGYLVGTLDRFNNAKRVEVEDRVKHNL